MNIMLFSAFSIFQVGETFQNELVEEGTGPQERAGNKEQVIV